MMRQTHPFYQPVDAWAVSFGEPGDENFSRLDTLENCRAADGKLDLKIVYPQMDGSPSNTWRQTTNPVTATANGVDGFESVETQLTANAIGGWGTDDGQFYGLEAGLHGLSLLDASVNHGHWFYAVGASEAWSGGIPGPGDFSVGQVEVWAQCGTAGGGPDDALMLGGDGQLVANTQLDDVDIPLDYTIGIDITPGPVIQSAWSSIVHFTATDTDCCDYGSRIPGVWFWPGTRLILVVDGHGPNGNSHTGEWGCDDSILTLAEGQTYNLKMQMTASTVHIYVNDQLACDQARSDRAVHTGVKVYMADPWYVAADATVANLYLLGGE